MTSRRIVVVGGTSAIAEHCVRRWLAKAPAEVVLVGRDATRLARVADDLRVRAAGSTVAVRTGDLLDPAGVRSLVDSIAAEGPIDIAIVAHGSLPDQDACQDDLAANADALAVNALSPALFAEAFAGHMARAGRGRLALVGSVAGDRGRQSNYVYGSAKGLVARYAQGLQHRFAGTAVTVTLVKPGPTASPMTAALQAKGMKGAPVEDVAAAIVDAIDAGRRVVYAPAKWALIMQVIRHLPGFVFDRMRI